ncbi:hypothetical protein Tco_0907530 [Tanacetum coccineum]|uniref:Uncharacterized protein n=1 Tax=Tanacetum coccineum TaxID=301880 RepID=A0ABQ5CJK3_9ASTR
MTASCMACDAVSRLCEHKSSRVLVLEDGIFTKSEDKNQAKSSPSSIQDTGRGNKHGIRRIFLDVIRRIGPSFRTSVTQQSQAKFPQLDSGLIVPMFPPSKNQLRTSSNPRNQATIQDGRVTVQQIQGRQTHSFAGTGNRGNATNFKGTNTAGQPQILDEEQLAFLVDPGVYEAPIAQQIIPQNATFQTEDLDAYDSDCDDLSSAKAVLMANLSSCDSDVYLRVPNADSYPNDMLNQDDTNLSAPNDLLILSLVEQMTDQVANLDKDIQTNKMVNESLSAELERYKERFAIFEQRQNVDLNTREKLIDSKMDDIIRNKNAKLEAFKQEIDTLKETLSNNVKETESLSTTLTVFKTKSKEEESLSTTLTKKLFWKNKINN